MSAPTDVPRWNQSSREKSCYELDFDEKDEMCDKCHYFSERMSGIGKKPRKGSKPKCERVKLMKETQIYGRLKLKKQHFHDIIEEQGGVEEKNMDLLFSRLYLPPSQFKVSLAIYKTCFTGILTPTQALHTGNIYLEIFLYSPRAARNRR